MLKMTRQLFALQPDVRVRRVPRARAVQSHPRLDGSRRRRAPATWCRSDAACGASTRTCIASFTCCVGSGMESHALHGVGIYYEVGRSALGQSLRAVDGRWEARACARRWRRRFRRASGDAHADARRRRRRSRWRCGGRRGPATASPSASTACQSRICRSRAVRGAEAHVENRRPRPADIAESAAARFDARQQAAGGDPLGPLVLAGDLGPEPPRAGRGLNADGSALVEAPRPVATPMLVAAERPIGDWLKPVAGKPGTFRTAASPKIRTWSSHRSTVSTVGPTPRIGISSRRRNTTRSSPRSQRSVSGCGSWTR